MGIPLSLDDADALWRHRAQALFDEHQRSTHRRTSRMFAVLMALQFVAGVVVALLIAPRQWEGVASGVHLHVWSALLLGGAISSLPIALALEQPDRPRTRYVVAVGQTLTSALLIHLTGGRIETHFHVFGSLAFLAFYRDGKVLAIGAGVVAVDHLLRGVFWPYSVYGTLAATPWRSLEHAGWVVFEVVGLFLAIGQSRREVWTLAARQGQLEATTVIIEERIEERTAALSRSEERLRLSRDAAQAASRAKSEFLTNMSHEMRTPLNGIIGLTELLLHEDLPPACRNDVAHVLASSRGLLAIVDDILDLTTIESRRVAGTPFAVEDLLRTTSELMRPRAVEKGLTLSLRVAEDVPPRLLGDAAGLRQVLANLVGNAVKFTLEGQVLVEAVVAAREGSRVTLEVRVSDSGIGIEPEQRELIFERFTQADGSSTRRFGGVGLGLSIARGLVQRMGGTLQVSSTPGVGSTFWFSVPLEVVGSGDVPDGRAAGATAGAGTVPAEAGDAEGAGEPHGAPAGRERPLVLVVEDNEVNRLVACRMLERLGCDVETAEDGLAAVTLVARRAYDLVVMDCQMPVLDGYGATRRIREAEHGGRHTPIVALTAHAMEGDREACLQCGMDDYVSKPVQLETLRPVVERWLAWGRGEARLARVPDAPRGAARTSG